jgi:hypothetical protein
MNTKPTIGTRVWWMIFPLLVGAGAFALGGIGPGAFAFILAGICSVVAARLDARLRVRASDPTAAQVRAETFERFRRWWLIAVAAVVVGVGTTFVAAGTRAGVVTLVCAVALVAGGRVALAAMRDRGGGV